MNTARLAVIDLGTNTFHLLIVEASVDSYTELYRERIFVNLAEEGIEKICSSALERGLEALKHFRSIIVDHGIKDIEAVGTAALRRASNSDQFVHDVKQKLGIAIRVIDGQREAAYINGGVMMATPHSTGNFLIMDIGGGSVEFIISSNRQPMFSVSYPIGVAVLYDKFHHSEPITRDELNRIDLFLEDTVQGLTAQIEDFSPLGLVGASGTFEVIDSALQKRLAQHSFSSINRVDFFEMFHRVVPMNYEERQGDSTIPLTRARYIVVALKLIEHILAKFHISSMGVSSYAMKEGIVNEWRNNLD